MISDTLKNTYGISLTIGGSNGTVLGLDPKSMTPPGMDAGDPIDNTTQSNTKYKTFSPKTLVELTNSSFTAAYDPGTWATILAKVGVNSELIFTFADATTLTVWGFLKTFIPNEHGEETDATAECELVITNVDAAGAEIAPIHT